MKDDEYIESGSNIEFYITSDVHYFSDQLTDQGEAYEAYITSGNGRQIEYIDEICSAFADQVKKKKPEVLIISGDLTNNGEKASHIELSQKLKEMEQNGTSVYVIPGNHDILNPWARSFKNDKQYVTESISPVEFSEIYADFGYQEAVSKDKETLSYLAAPSDDVWILMLDTNKYKNNVSYNMPEADGILAKGTLDWIAQCANEAKEKGATIITVMHHNIIDHSEVIQEGYTLNNSEYALNIFKESNLNLIFSGHIHIQDISSDQKGAVPVYDIASGALSVYPHQYGTLTYNASAKSFLYNTSVLDVESWAKKERSKDENLLHFESYAEDFFGKFAYDRAYQRLLMEDIYSKEEMEAMAEVMKILNLRYFAGREYLNSEDIVKSEGYQLWKSSGEGFMSGYMNSVITDKDTDDNKLVIKLPE
ncbi:MAG: hypothetical protein K0S47_247 [Herbinix sp.]|jgi:3',5'-cyclic AMP phosphodiesterase CpdA|nr:hypothetical protein [Herbinix sp.]